MSFKGLSKLIVIVTIAVSCGNQNDYREKESVYRNSEKTNFALRLYLKQCATDSINKWIRLKYEDVMYLDSAKTKWIVDSFIVFDATKKRATGVFLAQFIDSGKLDAIGYLDFEKKNNKWYIFFGATQYLPRNCYNNSKIQCSPIPMDTLRKEGRQYLLGMCYVKERSWSREYVINERYFKDEFEVCWGEQGKRDWITGKSRKRLTDSLPASPSK